MLGEGGGAAGRVAVQPGQEGAALKVGRNLDAGEVEDGGQDVERLGEA